MFIRFSEKINDYINHKIIVDEKKVLTTYSDGNFLSKLTYEYEKEYAGYLNKYMIANLSLITKTPKNYLNILKVTYNDTSIQYGFILYDERYTPLFVCVGPCIITNYSEYRTSLFGIEKLEYIMKLKHTFHSVYDFIETNLKSKVIQLSSSLEKKDYIKDIFIVAVLYHLYDKQNWSFYNYNANPIYMKLMDTIIYPIRSYANLYKQSIKNIIQLFYTKLSSLYLDLGCKLTPLYIDDLRDIHDLRIPIWKNIYINLLTNHFITSGVSDNFLLSFGWRFIYTKDNIYTNEEIYTKVATNNKIRTLLSLHKKISEYMEDKKDKINLYDNTFIDIKKNIISNEKLLKSMNTLSDLSIFQVYENRDNTFYNYVYNYLTYSKKSIFVDMVSNHSIFKKFIFEISYALLTIHHNGIIHYDLHANNIIVDVFNNQHIKKSKNIYVIDPNYEYMYTVPIYGFSTHLIDFDRALLSSKYISNTENHINDIIYELSQFIPSIKSNTKLLNIFKTTKRYDMIFRLFSSFDFLKIISILLNILSNDSIKKTYNKNKDYIKTIESLKEMHRDSTRYIQRLVQLSTFSKTIHDEELYAFTFIRKYFSEFRVDKKSIVSTKDSIYKSYNIYATKSMNTSILKLYDRTDISIYKEFIELNKQLDQQKKERKKYNDHMNRYVDTLTH